MKYKCPSCKRERETDAEVLVMCPCGEEMVLINEVEDDRRI